MQKGLFSKLTTVFLLLTVVFGSSILSAYAQVVSGADAVTSRAKLESELATLEKEIVAQEQILNKKQKESVSLERDLAILNAQITKTKLSIKARDISIANLIGDIGVKNKTIVKYSGKIEDQRDSLSALIRRTAELDISTGIEVALSNKTVSEFYADLDAFQYVEDAISDSLNQLGDAKKVTEVEKTSLEDKKAKEVDLRKLQDIEKKWLQSRETEKKSILKDSKGQEALYKIVLKDKQNRASQIRAALFTLRDTDAIPFDKALEYATGASKATGVRTALILAILKQESNYGENVGGCLLSSLESGDGVGKNTGTIFKGVMKSPRDTTPFKNIVDRLGLDWRKRSVSCPQPGGYGGGMGPTQFIASTWELISARTALAVGVNTDSTNPWNPRHAIFATAFYMDDRGADKGGYTAERNAACRYYSGSSCPKNPKTKRDYDILSYGNGVLKKADGIQANIDFLNGK